jgi:hypothetical protein
MTKIVIESNVGGTGVLTVYAPSTSNTATINLPTSSGDLLTTGSTGLNANNITTGILAVANGGTGAASFSSAGIPELSADQTFTGAQRGTVTTDNDGSFDMNVTNNFKCTPTGSITLTFTNITAGQSGFILLVNGSNYTVSAAATTKVATGALTTLSATGTYLLSYFSDGTNVFVVNSGALS